MDSKHGSASVLNETEYQSVDKATLLKVIRIQTEVVSKSYNLDQIMFLVALRAEQLLQADGGVVELLEDQDMVYRAATGMAENFLGLRLKMASSLSGLCIKQKQPLISNDSINDERADRAACARIDLRSMLVVPLLFEDEVVGVLKVLSKKVDNFKQQDILILGLLSDLISAAMHTASKYGKDTLYLRATTDEMTGIKNRSVFFDALHSFIKVYDSPSSCFCIIIFDMDGLKQINDQFGHLAGDQAILEVVRRIETQIRETDVFCRLGGDEFGLILNHLNSKLDAEHLIDRIRHKVSEPFQYQQKTLNLSVSIGQAYYAEDAKSLNGLIDVADQRMYQDKRQRKAMSPA